MAHTLKERSQRRKIKMIQRHCVPAKLKKINTDNSFKAFDRALMSLQEQAKRNPHSAIETMQEEGLINIDGTVRWRDIPGVN